jgi:hypothetical protein
MFVTSTNPSNSTLDVPATRHQSALTKRVIIIMLTVGDTHSQDDRIRAGLPN